MAPTEIDAAVYRQLGELVAGMRGLQESIRRLEEGSVRAQDKAPTSRAAVHQWRISLSTVSGTSRHRLPRSARTSRR